MDPFDGQQMGGWYLLVSALLLSTHEQNREPADGDGYMLGDPGCVHGCDIGTGKVHLCARCRDEATGHVCWSVAWTDLRLWQDRLVLRTMPDACVSVCVCVCSWAHSCACTQLGSSLSLSGCPCIKLYRHLELPVHRCLLTNTGTNGCTPEILRGPGP